MTEYRSLLDRTCEHGFMPCEHGCHDLIGYTPPNGAIDLMCDLLEEWANEGRLLAAFHAQQDLTTGHDGLDEITQTAMTFMAIDDEMRGERFDGA